MSVWQFIVLLLVMLQARGVTGQSPFEATTPATLEAIARGEAKEALAVLETMAFEAEKNAASNPNVPRYRVEASNAYREASRAAMNIGQLQKAIAHASKALEAAEKTKNFPLRAGAIYQLQQSYRLVGNYGKAREWIDKGVITTRQIPVESRRRPYEAAFRRDLGMDLLRQGKREEAIQHTSQALELFEQHLAYLRNELPRNAGLVPAIKQAENNVVSTLYRLGIAYQRAGKVGEAIQAYEKGIDRIKNFEVKSPVEVSLYWGLGDLYFRQKKSELAVEILEKALAMAEKLNLSNYIYLASSQLGALYLQTRRPAGAIPYYKKAIDNLESTRSLLESEDFRSSYFEDKRGTYAGMILAQLRTKNAAEAFNYSERARARAFLDILGSKVQLARSGTLLEHERALQGRISVLQAMMAGQEPGSGQAPQLREELAGAQQAYNEFLTQVRKENKEQAALMNVEPLTLKEVQELLDPGVTMLEYFVARDAVWLWVVEKDRFRFVNIPIPRSYLVPNVTWLRETVYQIDEKDRFNSYSQELFKLLIEPALPHVRGKELLIIPHDVLHYLPFQALLSSQGKYLIQDYPVYYLSSASLMQFTKQKRRSNRGGARALVMGNPDLGDQAYDLRYAEREAKEIAKLYPESAVYLREQATKPKALELSPKYEILHFAVHGELNEHDPLGSALLLADKGKETSKLKVAEIFSLNLKADAVVLSACETALGKLSNGDELVGLTRAFIYAGTPSVIATLWKVDDRASYELMREFYSNLKTMRKSEALRHAQLKTMKEFPQPYFWAAYGLTGEP